MKIKSSREYSFKAMVEAGKTKEEIMQHFGGMTEKSFNKNIADLERIKKEETEKKK